MTKEFFIQYQYMTFLLTAVAALYYVPYAVFKKVNEDMASLKKSIEDNNAEMIVNNYFSEEVNPKARQRIRVVGGVIVKAAYIVVTILAFIIVDRSLNNGFAMYGGKW